MKKSKPVLKPKEVSPRIFVGDAFFVQINEKSDAKTVGCRKTVDPYRGSFSLHSANWLAANPKGVAALAVQTARQIDIYRFSLLLI